MRLLLVDDDEALMDTLMESLIQQRYAVDVAIDGETAHDFLALFSYDLIVLDMVLPDVDGISLCRQFRQQGVDVPILMLTAQEANIAKVQALDSGADDYVVKPFDFDELCARIRALLRRDSQSTTAELIWGKLCLKPQSFEVSYGEYPLHMTPKEYAMLELFLRNPNHVFSLNAIIDNLWSFEDPPSGDAVRTHIKGLRQKLKAGGAPKDLIETVYGVGYRLKPLKTDEAIPSEQSSVASESTPTQADITIAVTRAWENHKDTMHERLSVLEATATALASGHLNVDLQDAGRAQAHKLAGSLGCFGFADGSRFARELEQLLQLEAPLGDDHVSRVSTLVHHLRQNLNEGAGAHSTRPMAPTPQVMVIGADDGFNPPFATEALARGLHSVAVSTLAQAQDQFTTHHPDAVLVWLDQAKEDAIQPHLQAIAQHAQTIPLVIVTDRNDFSQRLQLVQQGVDRILPTSTSAKRMVEEVQQMLKATQAASTVLIVDDDAQVLDGVTTLLSPWGFKLETLEYPAQLWQMLDKIQPDLLVLDIDMPDANGLELCQVLRADDQWRQLPILFLTIHEDRGTQHQAFNVGADDFISKTMMATELPLRILNRLRRSQQQRYPRASGQ